MRTSPRVPWTVRVATWSARHRWPVFVLWFAATLAMGASAEPELEPELAPLAT